jgi:hypothetical protein
MSLGQRESEGGSWARAPFFSPGRWVKLTQGLETVALLLALVFTAAFVVLALLRMLYPFEISLSESAITSMTLRRIRGEPVYGVPSLFDGACSIYPSLFFDLSALMARALGIGTDQVSFLPMRLLSIASFSATLVATVWLLRWKKRTSWKMAFILGAILPATYGRMDFWYDNARVDCLFVLFLFISTAIMLEGDSLRSAALAGIFGGLSTLTKQPAIVLLGLAGVHTVFVKRQFARAAAFALAFVGVVLGYLLITGDLLNPGFFFWVLKAPGSPPILWKNLARGLAYLALVLPFLTFFAALPVVLRIRRRGKLRGPATPVWSWSLVYVQWTLLSLVLHGKEGASVNFFMPLVPVGIMAISEGFAWIAERGLEVRRIVALTAMVQLSILVYNPVLFIPTQQAADEASALVDVLKEIDGPVWFPAYPSYAALAGKPWVNHIGTLIDLDRAIPGYVADQLSPLIRGRYFGAIVLHPEDRFVKRIELRQFYEERPLPAIRSPFLGRVHHTNLGDSIFVRRSQGSMAVTAQKALP